MTRYLTVTGKININKYGKKELLYDEEILKFINELNFNISVLNFNKKLDLKSLKKSNGLILTGGGDIYKYSKKKNDKYRDNLEIKLFNYFQKANKPILAICRGYQLIMSFYNCHISKQKGHVRTTHNLNINKSRFLKLKKVKVNSYHKFSVFDVPNQFKKISLHKDKSVEISEHKTKKIICLMFHPERKIDQKKEIIKNFKSFFK